MDSVVMATNNYADVEEGGGVGRSAGNNVVLERTREYRKATAVMGCCGFKTRR